MALPFSIIVIVLKSILGPITADSSILYRLQGVLWTILLMIYLIRSSINNKNRDLSKFAIFLSIFIIINPYILQTSQFFRYYSFYIAASGVLTFFILQYDSVFQEKRKWFYILLSISFFIYLFITVQLITYIFFKELYLMNAKRRKLVYSILGSILIIIFLNLPEYLTAIWHRVFPVYAFDFPLIHRGFSTSTMLKPFMMIFTFMFGRNLAPFSYKFLDICYIISGFSIIYGIFILHKNNLIIRHPLIFSAIIPLFISIIIIEPISLPMMPQIAPQHLIFLLPWLAYIFFYLWNISMLGKGLNIIFFSGLLYAGYLHQEMEFVDWGKIQETIKSENTPIITDATGSFDIYLQNNEVIWFRDTESVKKIIDQKDTIAILVTNWKYYQEIAPLQFWHNPDGTEMEYNTISLILLSLMNSGYSLFEGYSFFPYHSYTFAKNKTETQKIPWLYDLKYRDLKVPLFIENKKIIGFEKIDLKQSVYFDSTFYYFIQTGNLNDSNHTIEITFMDSTKKQYNLAQEDDTFRSYFCRSIANDKIVQSFNKMPLVSNSMRYPGSMFNSEVRIFKHEEIEDIYTIKCNKPGLILIKAIVSDI